MHDNVHPKIILNDDYVDLRQKNNSRKSRSVISNGSKKSTNTYVTSLKNEGLQNDKELINFGLKKLATEYTETNLNSRNKGTKFKCKESRHDPRFRRCIAPSEKKFYSSQSELSLVRKSVDIKHLSPSTPTIQSKEMDLNDSTITYMNRKFKQNKSTMTPERNPNTGKFLETDENAVELAAKKYIKSEPSDKVLELIDRAPLMEAEYFTNPQWRDPRLLKKYSVLKVPWRRTWTIPVFTPKSTIQNCKVNNETFDRQTYQYDDGTDLESYVVDKRSEKSICKSYNYGNFLALILIVGGVLCGIFMVSFMIWIAFGNYNIAIFKSKEDIGFRKHLKNIGVLMLHFVANTIKSIGRILSLPTTHVFTASPEHPRWQIFYYNN